MSKAQEPEIKEKGSDLEAGGGGGPASAGKGAAADAVLYPKMTEDPRLRWAFIRKVYAILAAQFVFTSGVAAAVSYVRPVPAFILSNTAASWTVFVAVLLSPFLGEHIFPAFPRFFFWGRFGVSETHSCLDGDCSAVADAAIQRAPSDQFGSPCGVHVLHKLGRGIGVCYRERYEKKEKKKKKQ